MKKFLFIATLALSTYAMQAQGFGAGIHAGYLTEIDAVGAGADLNYDFNEKWGIAFNGTFAATEDGGIRDKWLALDLNGRYYVVDNLYALAGGEYLSLTVKNLGLGGGLVTGESTVTDSEFGINLGTGYRYTIVDNVSVFAEVKYVVLDAGYVHARAGLHFGF
ncbi:porin family protein [Rasiella rasia]|uniref:Porin family protein n=1 Tax=Rasiella rasia TaxID=2744027 RepID=A0A6G6GJE7_9FLAO|nr:outer membrane beta-barrel protein [Rasiella rasia]QIE58543.1 porin family protein [Rasiella rasia]